MEIKLGEHIPTSFDYKFIPNINTNQHYVGKTGRLLGITMEARNDLTNLEPIMWMDSTGKYNKGRKNILKLSCSNT